MLPYFTGLSEDSEGSGDSWSIGRHMQNKDGTHGDGRTDGAGGRQDYGEWLL